MNKKYIPQGSLVLLKKLEEEKEKSLFKKPERVEQYILCKVLDIGENVQGTYKRGSMVLVLNPNIESWKEINWCHSSAILMEVQ